MRARLLSVEWISRCPIPNTRQPQALGVLLYYLAGCELRYEVAHSCCGLCLITALGIDSTVGFIQTLHLQQLTPSPKSSITPSQSWSTSWKSRMTTALCYILNFGKAALQLCTSCVNTLVPLPCIQLQACQYCQLSKHTEPAVKQFSSQ